MRARDVIGRKIVKMDLNRFADGNRGWAFDPVFTLDNGAELHFTVQEISDASGYGVKPSVRKPRRKNDHQPE